MRVAFVGKGGSGKTTIAALFAQYVCGEGRKVLAVDADINMHMGELLGIERVPERMHLSNPGAISTIKSYLVGNNKRIKGQDQFRKTTPPTADSNFILPGDQDNPILKEFSIRKANLSFMVVGSYNSESIGASCYHNDLAILESMLTHLIDQDISIVVDMVAGTDAFANTLHAQFDLLVLIVEPTRRGIEVLRQYQELAKSAGVEDHLVVVGNKVKDENDAEFLIKNLSAKTMAGSFGDSVYVRNHDKEGGPLEIKKLEEKNRDVLRLLANKLTGIKPDSQMRLNKLYELHRKYVSQASIKERFGDLTNQIDPEFSYEKVLG